MREFIRIENIMTIFKNKKFIVGICLIIAFLISILPNENLEIKIEYGLHGTAQGAGVIEIGQKEKEVQFLESSSKKQGEALYKCRYNYDVNDSLQMSVGDFGGTIYIDNVQIYFKDKKLIIEEKEIEKYFAIINAETIEVEENYLKIFTVDATATKLVANEGLLAWLENIESIEIENIQNRVFFIMQFWVLFVFVIVNKFLQDKKKYQYFVLFALAFLLYFLKILPYEDMISVSGDAASIWKTITTYYSENIEASYVLYKGMFSVYPYVWLYQLSKLCAINDFFFIKLYNVTLFAYVVAIGMPYIFEKILKKDIAIWKKWLFIILVFNLQVNSGAYLFLSIDLPSWFFFVLLMHIIVRVWSRKRISVVEVMTIGVSAGATNCFSGQYKIALLVAIIFFVVCVLKCKMNLCRKIVSVVIILFCIIGVGALNTHFEERVVEPMRDAGEAVQEGSDWLRHAFTRENPRIGYGYPSDGDLYDSQVIKVIEKEQPDYSHCDSVGQVLIKYFGMMLKYPVEFLSSCGNKLFMAFCTDVSREWTNVSLFVGFALFYIAFLNMISRYVNETVNDKMEYFIGVAFLCSILPACVMHMELRYALAIQSFVYGFAIFGGEAKEHLFNNGTNCESCKKLTSKQNVWLFVGGLVFIMFCIMHYYTLLD